MARRLDLKVVGPYGVAFVVSGFFYFAALQIAPAADNQLGPAVWPKTILLLAMLTCIWQIGHSVFSRGPKQDAPTNEYNEASLASADAVHDTTGVKSYTPWLGIALTLAYVAAFSWRGYPLATFLYVSAFVFFGNYRRPLAAVCIGFVASLAFMFLFMRVVYVSLPIGIEPFAQVTTLLMGVMGVK